MKKNNCFPIIPLLAVIVFYSGIHKVSAQCTENFDAVTAPALPAGWNAVTLIDCTGSDPWVTSTSVPYNAPNSAFVTAPGCVSDEVLVSKYFFIGSSSAQLTFRRKHGLEQNYDGLVLEISIEGGSFADIITAGGSFVSGGYNGIILTGSSPIANRQCWTGSTSSAFITTTVNLPASANGKFVVLRWRRATDPSVSGTGVFIDDITITGCTTPVPPACTENFDGVTVPALPKAWTAVTALDCVNSNPWATVSSIFDSPPNSVFVNDPDCISDEYLYSRLFQIITTTAQITFRRNNDLETNYDGMVLEISIGGVSFMDVLIAGCTFVSGSYTGTISTSFGNPLSGRSAWTGNSGGWVTTTINLPATANGKNIILRWRRGADNSVSGTGAYIDGLSITGSLCFAPCATNITLTPPGGNFCISSNPVVLTASVPGAVYDWYRNDVKINGVTGASYTANSGGIYYVKSVIGGCLATSNVAVLEPGSIIPTLIGTGVYCSGFSVNVGMTVTENGQDYSWRQNGIPVAYLPTGGGGGSYFHTFTMDASRVGDYVVFTTKPGCVGVYSNTVYVRLPVVTGLAIVRVCPDTATIKWNHVIPEPGFQSYEYSLSQSGTPPTSGEYSTYDSVTTVAVIPSTLYYFHIRSYCETSGFGNWASISFTTPPNNLIISPQSGSFCTGINSILLTASGGGTTFEWYKNDVLINGQTSSTYNASSGGAYYVKSIVGTCIISSTVVYLESAMVPPSLGGTGIYCTDDPVNIGIPVTEVGQDYTWKQNGVSVYGPIGGNGGNQSLQFPMAAGKEGTYIVSSTKPGCNVVYSNTVYVGLAQINNLMTTNICGGLVTFKWKRVAPVNISQTYSYEVTPSSTPVGTGISTSDSTVTVASLNPSTTYYIHVRSACVSGFGDWATISFVTPAALPPPVTSVWTGVVNTAWSNAANWQCGQLPVITTAVIINGGRPNYPQVTTNMTLKSLTVNPGASVQVNTGVVITLTGL